MMSSDDNSRKSPVLSVIVPVYNEEGNIYPLCDQIVSALSAVDRPWEVILVDDGSSDGSADEIDRIAENDTRFTGIHLRRNFGQTAAMAAGFDHGEGEIIIAMDADLQNDPADIPKLLEKIDEGYHVVSGWRKDRKDPWFTRILPSRIANWVISVVTGVRLHDYGCSLKAYRQEVLEDVQLYGEMHRFIPALCHWQGGSVAEVPVSHHQRQRGTSNYGISRVWRVFLDLITVNFLLGYSTKPIRVFGAWGLLAFFLGFLLSAYLSFRKFAYGEMLSKRPALLLGVLLLFIGVQLITMGLLAELVTRTYHEAQQKPIYAVRRTVRAEEQSET